MSVVSGSSFGGSMSGISQQALPKDEVNIDDDEADLDDEHHSFVSGLFGVIYTVSRERTVTWKFVAFKVFLDAWQLLMLTINPNYGWTIDGSSKWWYAVSFIQLQQFMRERGLTFFLVCLYIFEVLLFVVVGVCIWVAWSFRVKRFDHVWPITFLRWFGVIFFQMLDVASMNLILMTMDTYYFGVDASSLYQHNEFPGVYIGSMPYVIHVLISAVCLIIFTVLSTLFSMGEVELNMVSTNMLAMAHTKVEVLSFLLKFVMTCASVFLQSTDNKWLAGVYLGASWLLVYINIKWIPCYYSWMNYIRAGTYGAVCYSAFLMVLLVFQPGVDANDQAAVYNWNHSLSLALAIGIVPVAGLFVLAAYLRTWYFTVVVVNRFKNAEPGTKLNKIHVFKDALEVEIAGRCCRKWVEPDVLDDAAVQLAGRVLEAGMQQLPNQPYMSILHSSYHIDVQGSFQTGLLELKAAKKLDPSFLEQFAIFSREQQLTQKAAGGVKGSKGEDLVSYVEQQHDYRLAVKVHREALLATSAFWKTLMHPEVKFVALTKAVAAFDVAVKHADVMYRNMLQRHPENWRLLRMYAKFVEFIKNDPWGAAKWNAEADRLWEEEEDDKHNLFNVKDLAEKDERMANLVKYTMEDNSKGVIIMNAQCIMGFVNKTACQMFGYDVRGLRGQNVNVLLPSPYAEQHDGWVRNYTNSDRSSRPLERLAKWVAMHHDRYVFGVQLWIGKISGSGMDCMFMGTIEPLPVPQNTAFAWVLGSGVLVSTDNVFSDWFAYRAEDLAGCDMASLIVEEHLLQDALKAGLAKDAAKYHSGKPDGGEGLDGGMEDFVIENIQVRHKYAGPIPCSITVSYGGVGQHHLFILAITRARSSQLPMIVTDSKGKVCHASKDVATTLGYTVPQLMDDLSTKLWDVIIPQPFAQLHRIHVAQELLTKQIMPCFSCRSGLTICVNASSPQGPQLKPVRLRVQPRRREEGDICNIITFEKSSMSQAMDERRLSLIVDESGTIYQVGGSTPALFGFDPSSLIGKPIGSAVDVFKPAGPDAEVDETTMQVHAQEMLVELTKLCLENPDTAFRVGVSAPMSHGEGVRRGSHLFEAITAHMHSKGTRAAIMQVKLHMPDDMLRQVSVRSPTRQPSKQVRIREASSLPSGDLDAPRRPISARSGADSDPQMPKAIITSGSNPPNAAAAAAAAAAATAAGPGAKSMQMRQQGMQVEILLWRADLLSGVLELDPEGRVVSTADAPFQQPGLLLGMSSERLVGMHVSDILPDMAGRPMAHLFLPQLGASDGNTSAGKRGGLKKKSEGKRDRRPGAVNSVRSMHLVDGQELRLQVQAVYSWDRSKNIQLVMHVQDATLGMPDLLKWLLEHPDAGGQMPPRLALPPLHSDLNTPPQAQGKPAGAGGRRRSTDQQHSFFQRASESPLGDDRGTPGTPPAPAMPTSLAAHLRRQSLSTPPVATPPTQHTRFVEGQVAGHEAQDHERLHTPPKGGRASLDQATLAAVAAAAAAADAAGAGAIAAATTGTPSSSKKRLLAPTPDGQQADGQADGQAAISLDNLLKQLARTGTEGEEMGQGAPAPPPGTAPPVVGRSTPSPVPPSGKSASRRASAEMPRVAAWVMTGGAFADSAAADAPRRAAALSTAATQASLGHSMSKDSVGEIQAKPGHKVSDSFTPGADSTGEGESDRESDDDGSKHGAPVVAPPNINMLVKDAIGALGGNRGSPSDDGEDAQSASGMSDGDGAAKVVTESVGGDYKRGQRFKRVARLLLGDSTRRHIRSFRYKGYGVAAFAICVSLACFITMYVLLKQQQAGVDNLNVVGRAAVKVTSLFLIVVDIDLLFKGLGQPTLPHLSNASDIPFQLKLLQKETDDFMVALTDSYYKVMSLPDMLGLHFLWNEPSINITQYYDSAGGSVSSTTTLMSLWDAGNMYGGLTLNVAHNAYSYNNTVFGTGKQWRDWKDAQFLSSNVVSILTGLLTTLDGIVEIVITSTQSMNTVQYIFAAVEGGVCSALAIAFIIAATTKMNLQRLNLYNVFIVVPMGLLKALASKTVALDEPTMEVQPAQHPSPDGEGAMSGAGGVSSAKLNFAGSAHIANDSMWAMVKETLLSWLSALAFWRARAAVAPSGGSQSGISGTGRRRLVRSHGTALLMALPFLMWGITMISINAAGHEQLAQVPAPIALFNLVNFVLCRFRRNFSLTQDMIATADVVLKNVKRANTLKLFVVPTEYKAMVFGGSSVPDQTSNHFTLASSGIAFTGGAGAEILYRTKQCLREDQSTCLPESSWLHPYVSNGLDVLVQRYFYTIRNVLGMNGTQPMLNSSEFELLWNVRPDIEGGLWQLNAYYYNYVLSVYKGCLTIHIIGLVVTVLLMVAFVLFLLRPFLTEINNETRRIAELLNQLPTEVDVEAMVRRSQVDSSGNLPAGVTTLEPSGTSKFENLKEKGASFA